MTVLLGAIADDFTGATDLCNTLVRRGMATVQLIGVPAAQTPVPAAEAVVVALKSRTIAPAEAVAQSLAALAWLQEAGARQFLFKYCSTFDSTPRGNIGPAFPEAGRTIFNGYLFVGDVLLSESGMKDHPLTPMRDPSLVRVLQAQSRGRVGLVPHAAVAEGTAAVAAAFAELRRNGVRHAVVDAIADRDLETIGAAAAELKLVTGGSGIALGLPANFRRQGLLGDAAAAAALPAVGGAAAVISGSCSPATQGQVAYLRERAPCFAVDPIAVAEGRDVAGEAVAWARPLLGERPVLVSATAPPEAVAAVQARLGRERAGALVEETMAAVAKGVAAGVRRLVVAGGETAGAVVQALGVTGLKIGAQIDPGVPWTVSLGEPALALALKSGNFGRRDFFVRAFQMLAYRSSQASSMRQPL